MRLAASISLFPLLAALSFLLTPQLAATLCGFPPATTPAHHTYITLLAAREAYIGLLGLTLWWRSEVRALGWLLVVLAVVPAVDGWVAWHAGVSVVQAMGHWGSIVAAVMVGYRLINA